MFDWLCYLGIVILSVLVSVGYDIMPEWLAWVILPISILLFILAIHKGWIKGDKMPDEYHLD